MPNTARVFSIILVLFVAVCGSDVVVSAASKRTNAVAHADVRQLLQLMDRDKNGTVSKFEFLRYMEYIFAEARQVVAIAAGLENPQSSPKSLVAGG
jgi:hypothetical protein